MSKGNEKNGLSCKNVLFEFLNCVTIPFWDLKSASHDLKTADP